MTWIDLHQSQNRQQRCHWTHLNHLNQWNGHFQYLKQIEKRRPEMKWFVEICDCFPSNAIIPEWNASNGRQENNRLIRERILNFWSLFRLTDATTILAWTLEKIRFLSDETKINILFYPNAKTKNQNKIRKQNQNVWPMQNSTDDGDHNGNEFFFFCLNRFSSTTFVFNSTFIKDHRIAFSSIIEFLFISFPQSVWLLSWLKKKKKTTRTSSVDQKKSRWSFETK